MSRSSIAAGRGAAQSVSGDVNGVGVRLAVGGDGLARAVWQASGAIRVAAQAADGAWGPPQVFAASNSIDLALAVDDQGRGHMAWAENEQLSYSPLP
jgi:hypothetical protein